MQNILYSYMEQEYLMKPLKATDCIRYTAPQNNKLIEQLAVDIITN